VHRRAGFSEFVLFFILKSTKQVGFKSSEHLLNTVEIRAQLRVACDLMSCACYAASIIPGVYKIKKKVAVVGVINGTQHILHLELRLRMPCSLAPAKIPTHNNPDTYKHDTSVATFPFITAIFLVYCSQSFCSRKLRWYPRAHNRIFNMFSARACARAPLSLSLAQSFFLSFSLSLSHSRSLARALFSLSPLHTFSRSHCLLPLSVSLWLSLSITCY